VLTRTRGNAQRDGRLAVYPQAQRDKLLSQYAKLFVAMATVLGRGQVCMTHARPRTSRIFVQEPRTYLPPRPNYSEFSGRIVTFSLQWQRELVGAANLNDASLKSLDGVSVVICHQFLFTALWHEKVTSGFR